MFGTILTIGGVEQDRALRAFKHDPSPENAEAYRVAKAIAAANPGKRQVSTRDVAEDHIREDIGLIPTVERWLKHLPIEPWMAGGVSQFKRESEPQPVD